MCRIRCQCTQRAPSSSTGSPIYFWLLNTNILAKSLICVIVSAAAFRPISGGSAVSVHRKPRAPLRGLPYTSGSWTPTSWLSPWSVLLFQQQPSGQSVEDPLSVYTENPELLYGVSHILLAPEHPLNKHKYYKVKTQQHITACINYHILCIKYLCLLIFA